MYVCVTTISKKKNLKESKKEYMGKFGGRKGKGKIM